MILCKVVKDVQLALKVLLYSRTIKQEEIANYKGKHTILSKFRHKLIVFQIARDTCSINILFNWLTLI